MPFTINSAQFNKNTGFLMGLIFSCCVQHGHASRQKQMLHKILFTNNITNLHWAILNLQECYNITTPTHHTITLRPTLNVNYYTTLDLLPYYTTSHP